MSAERLVRKNREQQLRLLLSTPEGQEEIHRLILAYLGPDAVPPLGSLMIYAILEHEYREEPVAADAP